MQKCAAEKIENMVKVSINIRVKIYFKKKKKLKKNA